MRIFLSNLEFHPVLSGESEVAQSFLTFCNPIDYIPPGSTMHRIFAGKHTGVGCHFLLQGIFPTQGSNPEGNLVLNGVAGMHPYKKIFFHHLIPELSMRICKNQLNCPSGAIWLSSLPFLPNNWSLVSGMKHGSGF